MYGGYYNSNLQETRERKARRKEYGKAVIHAEAIEDHGKANPNWLGRLLPNGKSYHKQCLIDGLLEGIVEVKTWLRSTYRDDITTENKSHVDRCDKCGGKF